MTENKKDINFSDDDIRGLFENFNPELNPDKEFMYKFERNLELMEMAAQYGVKEKTDSKKKAAWAAFGGFVAGIVSSLSMPVVIEFANKHISSIPDLAAYANLPVITTIAWILAGGITILTTLLIYSYSSSD